MSDSVPSEDQAPKRHIVVKLMQTVEVCSEQFDYPDVSNKKEALAKAQAFIDDEKDLEGIEYRLVAEEVEETVPEVSSISSDGTDSTMSSVPASEGASPL